MGYSAKVVLRRPARKGGNCQMRLIVVLDRRPVPVALKVHWPPALFDENDGRCLASLPIKERGPDYAEQLEAALAATDGKAALAKLASDYNLIIGQAQGKVNNIFVKCRLSSQVLSAERFLQEFNTEGSKVDFVTYFYHKILEWHRKGKTTDVTKKNHLNTWRAPKGLRAEMPFYSLSSVFVDDFKLYLDKKIKSLNTRWARHKDAKTYLAIARNRSGRRWASCVGSYKKSRAKP